MIPVGTPLGAVQVSLPGSPVAGLVDSIGRQIHLGKLEGRWDSPASSGQATQKVNDHGAFLSPAYYQPRIINWETRIDGFSPADSLKVARQLMASVPLDAPQTLTVVDGDLGALTAAVRQEGDPVLVRQGYRMVVSLSLIAPDPRRYGPTYTASTGLPQSIGGFVLPIVLPVSTGGSTVSGAVNIFNDGDMDSNPVFTITGPVPNWTITDSGGRQLASAEAVQAGRKLIIDTGARTVLLDGTATRVATGTWPVLRPGANEFRFNSTAYDAGAQLDVTYRSARR